MGIATDFYQSLFQQEQPAPRTKHCREEVWRHTPSIVQPSMGEELVALFTTAKVDPSRVDHALSWIPGGFGRHPSSAVPLGA